MFLRPLAVRLGVLLLVVFVTVTLAGCGGGSRSASKPEAASKPAETEKRPEAPAAGAEKPVEQPGKPASSKKIIIANPDDVPTFMPIYFGVDKGFFAREGLQVEVTNVKTNVLVSGLVAGEIDYGTAAGSILRGIVQGLPLKMLLYMAERPDFILVSRPEINSVPDLKGKVVSSTSPAATTNMALLATLKKFNVDPSEVTFQYIAGSADKLAALQSGAVSAAVLSPPFDSIAVEKGMRRLFFSGGIMDSPFTGIGTSEAKIKSNPEEVKAVLRAVIKIMDYIKDPAHKQELVDYIASRYKVSSKIAEETLKTELDIMRTDGRVPDEALQHDIEAAVKDLKLSQSGVKPGDVVDYSFLEEIMAEIGKK